MITVAEHRIEERLVPFGEDKLHLLGGTALISEDREARATMSLLAISLRYEGLNRATRPIVIMENGGPSTPATANAAINLGPFNVPHDEAGAALVHNPFEINELFPILDADVLCLDPVGTGLGQMLPGQEQYWQCGSQRDVDIGDAAVSWYTNLPENRGRPLIFAGTSYGAFRAVGKALALSKRGYPVAAVLIMNGLYDRALLNFNQSEDPRPFINMLPAMIATSQFHRKGQWAQAGAHNWEGFNSGIELARGEYGKALQESERLSGRERSSMAMKLAGLTGLSHDYFLEHDLRFHPDDYRRLLLEDEGLHLSFIDGRFTSDCPEGFIDPATIDNWEPLYIQKLAEAGYPGFSAEAMQNYKGIALLGPHWRWGEHDDIWKNQRLHEAVEELVRINPDIGFLSINGMYDLNCPPLYVSTFWNELSSMGVRSFLSDDLRAVCRGGEWPRGAWFDYRFRPMGHQLYDWYNRLHMNVAIRGLAFYARARAKNPRSTQVPNSARV